MPKLPISKTDLSVIIVNYNTGDYLRHCLESLSPACSHLTSEVIVVDNASTDGSERAVTQFSGVTLIKNSRNVGFAKANNIGIKKTRGEYVLLLNPDTGIEENTLKVMVDFMREHPESGAATCKVVLANGEIDWASHRGFPTPWASATYFLRLSKLFPKSLFFAKYHLTYKNLDQIHEIDSPSGAFYLVPRKVINKVGRLDEDYFMYGEDLDLSFRVKKAGFKIYYNPEVKIIHYKGIASGIKEHSKDLSAANLTSRIKATESFYDTMWTFYQKHYQNKYPKLVGWLVRIGITFLKNRRLAKIGE